MTNGCRRTVLMVAILLLPGLQLLAEDVAITERRFVLKFPDELERYVVRWTASADFSMHESGGPAEPLKGKFNDDRRCEWSSNGRIERRVFLVQRGILAEDPNKRKVYNTDFANKGSSFNLSNFRPGNCNDTSSQRDSDFSDTRTHLRNALTQVATSDFTKVTAEYSNPQATLVTAEAKLDGLCYNGSWNENEQNQFRWTFRISGSTLSVERSDRFASGTFTRTATGWAGSIKWSNGETWNNVTLSTASPACDEIRTNQVWYFKRR